MRCLPLFFALFAALPVAAQEPVHSLEKVQVTARRPMQQIGMQRTVLDSAILHENITSSLADALAAGSSIFIKSYGRATLATASFRGTSPSHTQVTWNGMKVNSPMLGQVDFSMIPAYFIDGAAIYGGASSVAVTGGGLGGAVTLQTQPPTEKGLGIKYIQGIGSFASCDEFARITYAGARWSTSTRVLYSSSQNDFRFRNFDTKEFVTDPDGNITGSYYPLQRNRNASFADLHLMQELYYTARSGSRFSLAAWYIDSHRGLGLLNADRSDAARKKNLQDEHTLRAVATWEQHYGGLKLDAHLGYTYTNLRYRLLQDPSGTGKMDVMTDARSRMNTFYGEFAAEYLLGEKWLFTADLTACDNAVRSGDLAGLTAGALNSHSRFEFSSFAAIRWSPLPRLGLAANIRWESYGSRTTPAIPALLADYVLSQRGSVVLKASVARNFRYPTVSDLWFSPDGNPDLRPERGWTADMSLETTLHSNRSGLKVSLTGFNSNIDDWILWIGTQRPGILTPLNVRRVHSYGAELKFSADTRFAQDWHLYLDGNFACTRSVNRGGKISATDDAIGKQLVYIPVWSGSAVVRLQWKTWELGYTWQWYSERFTTSNNAPGVRNRVPAYNMNDLSLEKRFELRWAALSLKGCIYNLFNAEYQSVLDRPMPRLNVSFSIGITPKFHSR